MKLLAATVLALAYAQESVSEPKGFVERVDMSRKSCRKISRNETLYGHSDRCKSYKMLYLDIVVGVRTSSS